MQKVKKKVLEVPNVTNMPQEVIGYVTKTFWGSFMSSSTRILVALWETWRRSSTWMTGRSGRPFYPSSIQILRLTGPSNAIGCRDGEKSYQMLVAVDLKHEEPTGGKSNIFVLTCKKQFIFVPTLKKIYFCHLWPF